MDAGQFDQVVRQASRRLARGEWMDADKGLV